jgi:hypothetical protein
VRTGSTNGLSADVFGLIVSCIRVDLFARALSREIDDASLDGRVSLLAH